MLMTHFTTYTETNNKLKAIKNDDLGGKKGIVN